MNTIDKHALMLKQGVYKGAYLKKEAPPDVKSAEAIVAPLLAEMGNIVTAL